MDWCLYKYRHLVENVFARLKHFRAIATRYDKLQQPLEQAMKKHHDFKNNPMVYTQHKISIDKKLLAQLKSNMALHILVRECSDQNDSYECYGLIQQNLILFRGLIGLASLESIVK